MDVGWLEKAELKPTQPSLAGAWLSLAIKELNKKIDEMELFKRKVQELETALNHKFQEQFNCKKCQKFFESDDSLKNHLTIS